MILDQIHWQFTIVLAALFGNAVGYIGLLQERVARIFLVYKNAFDDLGMPCGSLVLSFYTSGVERIGDLLKAHSVKVAAEDIFYDLRFLGYDFGETIIALFISKQLFLCDNRLL